jgi:hypothetical protein
VTEHQEKHLTCITNIARKRGIAVCIKLYIPNGFQCIECADKHKNCSAYNYNEMHVIKEDHDSKTVACRHYVKEQPNE